MMSALPTDSDVRRQLVDVRARVLEATRAVPSPRRSTRFRTTRNLLIAGISGAALTAGALYLVASQEQQSYVVECFLDADLGSPSSPVVYTGEDNRTYVDDGLTPESLCAVQWSIGAVDPDVTDTGDEPMHPVPPLTACTQTNGVAAVFPNRDELPADKLCGTLGLAVWDPDSGV